MVAAKNKSSQPFGIENSKGRAVGDAVGLERSRSLEVEGVAEASITCSANLESQLDQLFSWGGGVALFAILDASWLAAWMLS